MKKFVKELRIVAGLVAEREGVRSFGSDVVYIDRFPMSQEVDENGEELNWWDYLQRPEITEDDFEFVSRNASLSKSVVYVVMGNGSAAYGRRSYDNAYLLITTGGLENVMNVEVQYGRNFSEQEARGGANVAVLGHSVAQELFGNEDPVGKKVKIRGSSGMMLAAPADGADRQAFLDELRLLMRSCHGLSPSERDDFSLNEMTFLLDMLDTVFSGIAKAGWIIGAFSLIIGGFGIANIMFVSVQERMSQIGIQKALGARRYVIMTQFMVEASFLSLAGGLTGILLVLLVSLPVNAFSHSFTISMSLDNALSGMLISVALGILSGLLPAWKAASLDPVQAINA